MYRFIYFEISFDEKDLGSKLLLMRYKFRDLKPLDSACMYQSVYTIFYGK